jgi:hypothetical protein
MTIIARLRPRPKNIDILGANGRKQTRPRGFVEWRPRPQTQVVLDQVLAVLREYAAYLPLTIRQIFYRLVGRYDFEKTENAYDRLCEMMNRARRARVIAMSAIRDDGITRIQPRNTWDGIDDFLDTVRTQASRLRLDRTQGQQSRLVVMCEAAGMAPQLAQVCDPYGIMVLSSGGFDSVTAQYSVGREAAAQERPTEVLHIGDKDPSGVHILIAMEENVSTFARQLREENDWQGSVRFTRLAVTQEQVDQYNLPTAPPKETDRRAFEGETVQAEALPPDVLMRILREAIEQRLDREAYEQVLAEEDAAREELTRRLGE